MSSRKGTTCAILHNETDLRRTDNRSYSVAEIQLNYNVKVVPSQRHKVNSPQETSELLHNLWSNDIGYIEEFSCLFLDCANSVLGYKFFFKGGRSYCCVDPVVIFQAAILCGATSIVIAHNHPSGNSTPSFQDKELTYSIEEFGKVIGIRLLDHIVLTTDGYFSFSDNGLMNDNKGPSSYDMKGMQGKYNDLLVQHQGLQERYSELQSKMIEMGNKIIGIDK